MFTSGDRKSWITAVADAIMDGGANRPSVTDLLRIIPGQIVTGGSSRWMAPGRSRSANER